MIPEGIGKPSFSQATEGVHLKVLTIINLQNAQLLLTCKSWFRISGPMNWEASLPIYMMETNNKKIQIWYFN